MRKLFKFSCPALALTTLFVGCDGSIAEPESAIAADEHDGEAFIQASAEDDRVAPPKAGIDDAVLAHIIFPTGGSLKFIDESRRIPGAGIGLFEIVARDSPSYLAKYLGEYHATPLEIFTALAPDEDVPEALFDDHALKFAEGAEIDATPRYLPSLDELKLPVVPSATWNSDSCDTASAFHTDFAAMFSGYSNHVHFPNEIGNTTLTLTISNERAFGVCLTAGGNPYDLDITIESEQQAGVWQYIDDGFISNIDRAAFYSSSHPFAVNKYRLRTTDASGDTQHFEASW